MIEVSYDDKIFDGCGTAHAFRMGSQTFTPSKITSVAIPKNSRILKVGLLPSGLQNNEGTPMMTMAITFIQNHYQDEMELIRLSCLRIDEPVTLGKGQTAKLLGQVPVNNCGDSLLIWQITENK